jgi:dolichol-phosphate mannosyltransferase
VDLAEQASPDRASAAIIAVGRTVLIAVVIPCYRVRNEVLGVIARIGPEVTKIYCVDDACPEASGDYVTSACTDLRVVVLRNPHNLGVGGAMVAGYRQAIADGISIVVKIDGDGQMAPELLPRLVRPLLHGAADYAKGNRFYSPDGLRVMPRLRIFGNIVLSFVTKLSSGYWTIFDPTNGYTAIHRAVLTQLPLNKIARRFFFESDMLYRLNTLRAVVADVPMTACYDGEVSSLRISRIIMPFLGGNARNFLKRIVYNYFLRDFNVASVELVAGSILLLVGTLFGATTWIANARAGIVSPAGTVMLAGLPIIVGIQMLLAFVNFDVQFVPRTPIQRTIYATDDIAADPRVLLGPGVRAD